MEIARPQWRLQGHRLQGHSGSCEATAEIARPQWKLRGHSGDCKATVDIARPEWRVQGYSGDCKAAVEVARPQFRPRLKSHIRGCNATEATISSKKSMSPRMFDASDPNVRMTSLASQPASRLCKCELQMILHCLGNHDHHKEVAGAGHLDDGATSEWFAGHDEN